MFSLIWNSPIDHQVSLNCCRAVTERAMHTLLTKCIQIESISAKATDVGIIPPCRDDQLCGFKLFGSPLLSPPHKIANNTDTIMGSHDYLKGRFIQLI